MCTIIVQIMNPNEAFFLCFLRVLFVVIEEDRNTRHSAASQRQLEEHIAKLLITAYGVVVVL